MKSLNEIQREADGFRALVEEVREYERKADSRRGLQATLERSKGEIDRQRELTTQLNKNVTNYEQKLAKGEMTYQDIQANIEYRDRQKKILAHSDKVFIVDFLCLSLLTLYLLCWEFRT
jgi:predicted nuclease with TOPRIM domain